MKRKAVIFDRDGTLASCQRHLVDGTLKYPDWDEFNAWVPLDALVPWVADLLRRFIEDPGYTTFVTTGRQDHVRPQMVAWLQKYDIMPDHLLMRRTKDNRKDSIVKQEMYDNLIKPFYDVELVVDDRPQVVEMWRANGLNVIDVQDPGLTPPILRTPVL